MNFEEDLVEKINLDFESTLIYIARFVDLYKAEKLPWLKEQIKMIILKLVINLYRVEFPAEEKL